MVEKNSMFQPQPATPLAVALPWPSFLAAAASASKTSVFKVQVHSRASPAKYGILKRGGRGGEGRKGKASPLAGAKGR